MIHLANHHSHTIFSDGKTTPEIFALRALQENMVTLGFSDHAPIPHPGLIAMSFDKLDAYTQKINELKSMVGSELQIYHSLEVDYIPGIINVNSQHITQANLDYTIGAVHYIDQFKDGSFWSFESGHENFSRGIAEIFDGDVESAVKRYYALIREMVKSHPPDVIAHLDRIKKLNSGNRYFNEKEKWYQREVMQTLELISQCGCIMEVNTKGFYTGETADTYPGKWVLENAKDLGIPVHLASDAHHPDFIRGGFGFGLTQLKTVGYQMTYIMIDHLWQDSSLISKRFHIF